MVDSGPEHCNSCPVAGMEMELQQVEIEVPQVGNLGSDCWDRHLVLLDQGHGKAGSLTCWHGGADSFW